MCTVARTNVGIYAQIWSQDSLIRIDTGRMAWADTGAHPASYQTGTGSFFGGGGKADHRPLSSASSLTYVFMAWYLIS
jgi:hypothetical protein